MGKRRMRDRAEAATEKEASGAADDTNVMPAIVKTPHFQRKLKKQLEFNDKLTQLQHAAIAKQKKANVVKRKRKNVGKALGSLAGLAECLDGIAVSGPQAADALKLNPKTLKSRARVLLLATETERMSAVMAHPAYKADPLAAIRAHLEATVTATEQLANDPKPTKRRRPNKAKARKAAGASGGMED